MEQMGHPMVLIKGEARGKVSCGGLDESILLIKSYQQFSHYPCHNLHNKMFQKFNFDTKWAVRLISKITNDEDIPIKVESSHMYNSWGCKSMQKKFFFSIRKSLVEFDEVLEVCYDETF
ncbi:hypothetical protein HN873_018804 [Arachis hypogaea]